MNLLEEFLELKNFERFSNIFLCTVSLYMDPLFLYIPFLSHTKICLGMNTNLWKVAVALRTVTDLAYGFSSRHAIAELLLNIMSKNSVFIICINCLALAPIPQILFSETFILNTLEGYTFWNLILFCQYGTRALLIFRSSEKLKKRISVRAILWLNLAVYFYLYIIISNLIGGSWHYLSIKRQISCWNHACKIDTGCVHGFFHCDGTTASTLNSTLVNEFCPINPPNASVFDYGIYLDALQSELVEDKGILRKVQRGFFWGLRNLSSFASDLKTSTNRGETAFAIIISLVGLILLICVIGNAQGLDILEASIYPKKNIKRNAKAWLVDNKISPQNRKNILSYLKCRLEDDVDVNLKTVLSVLPYEHEWKTKKDLCFDTLKKVSWLKNINEEWFRSMSIILKPFIYPKESYIFREGEPLEFIIFITNGIAWRYSTVPDADGRASVSINSLNKGDFFGVELLEWKLNKRRELKSDRIPLSCIPISTANVKSHTKVEALVLMINDLALCSDFPVARSKVRRMVCKRSADSARTSKLNQMILKADQHKRSADSATEGVDGSSRTEEGASVQREIEEV